MRADWTWAPSALDHDQITRLSHLWFDALSGICSHVAHGGGGLTPSDIAPARLTQQQIDELQEQYHVIDVLPLTPMQQGLLFHSSTTHGNRDDVYAMQLDLTVTGPLDPIRLRNAVHRVVNRHPNLAARFCEQFDEPVQIIPADPVAPWRFVDLSGDDPDPGEKTPPPPRAGAAAAPPAPSVPNTIHSYNHLTLSLSSYNVLPNAPRSATWPGAARPVALIRTAKTGTGLW